MTGLVEVSISSLLTMEVTATAANGQTATDSRTFNVLHLLPAGEATVSGGNYVVKVVQPRSQGFAGRMVRFQINGQDTGQSVSWVEGEASVLDLAVGAP